MEGSQSELLESSYQCAQNLLHDNITLTDADAIDTKAETINDNDQTNPYQKLKRRILAPMPNTKTLKALIRGVAMAYLHRLSKKCILAGTV